jgi:site-specific DNA recombinase
LEQQRKITTIPASISRFTAAPIDTPSKRKVAAYARVSTDHDEQFTSYEAQIDYYTKFIKARDDWEFVKVYTDEGITGTSTKHREGFKRMVADALAGKDRSDSHEERVQVRPEHGRLADHHPKAQGTWNRVLFEKENIWTFDSKGELLITIMSSWPRRNPDPFQRTSPGARGSDLLTARCPSPTSGSSATTKDRTESS